MSTRGAIARPYKDGWEGRYHHFDAYPTGLGRALQELYHAEWWPKIDHDYPQFKVASMQKILIDSHPGGWSNIINADWSKPIGYGSHGPQCYCHGERSENDSGWIRETGGKCGQDCDPLFIEWAYILEPSGITVLAAKQTTDKKRGHKLAHEETYYVHDFVAQVDWDTTPEIWKRLEDEFYDGEDT